MNGRTLIKRILDQHLENKEILIVGVSGENKEAVVDISSAVPVAEITSLMDENNEEEFAALIINSEIG